jgi:hypothetical protein
MNNLVYKYMVRERVKERERGILCLQLSFLRRIKMCLKLTMFFENLIPGVSNLRRGLNEKLVLIPYPLIQ